MSKYVLCNECGQSFCQPSASPTENNDPRTVVVAADWQLLRLSHHHRLVMALLALGIPRRRVTLWLAHVIYNFKGQVIYPNGTNFGIPDIEVIFGEDGSYRWVGDLKKFAVTPPKQRPHLKVLPRLRVIDLGFRIAYPERAILIAK